MFHNPMTEGKRSQTKLTTMNTKNVTIEQLSERFNQTVWVKGDLKRIYLNDEGYNTKKMSTKTFIFEKDAEFIVSCRIECPSQPYQWIQSQEEEVKESVYSRIEDFIERILDPSIDAKEAEEEAKAAAELEAGREERERKAAEVAKEEEMQKKIEAEKTAAVFEAGGEKYSHSKFGVGVVVAEDDQTITLVFKVAGEKKLLKRFAPLSKVG
jgi:single-stranded DNA-specific DHH superfamily exonuclease